jgi:membrane protease YdiL (CAAX protease family)
VLAAALAVGGAAVACDLFVHPLRGDLRRAGFAAMAVAILLALARGDRRALGLRLTPHRGWLWWIRLSLIISLIMLTVIGLGSAFLWLIGKPPEVRSMFTSTDQFAAVFRHSVVVAPLVEEPVYRTLLCVPLVAALGRWPTIVVSGGVFGYLHFRYGNPSPDNFFAGYVLAWAYLESRSLLLPIIFHAAGNAIVVAGHIAVFHWLQ